MCGRVVPSALLSFHATYTRSVAVAELGAAIPTIVPVEGIRSSPSTGGGSSPNVPPCTDGPAGCQSHPALSVCSTCLPLVAYIRSGTYGVATTCTTRGPPSVNDGRIPCHPLPASCTRPPQGCLGAACTDAPTPVATTVPAMAAVRMRRVTRIRICSAADGRAAAAWARLSVDTLGIVADALGADPAASGRPHLRLEPVEVLLQDGSFERLVLGEDVGEAVQQRTVVFEQDAGAGDGVLQQPADRLVGVGLGLRGDVGERSLLTEVRR